MDNLQSNRDDRSIDDLAARSRAFWAMFAPATPAPRPALARQVDWDELDAVVVIGLDSEGRRRVYTSTDDYTAQLLLARHLQVHLDDMIRAAAADVA